VQPLTFAGAALRDISRPAAWPNAANDDPVAVPHGAYLCGDGEWVALSCWSDCEFAVLAKAMGEASLAGDPRFAASEARRANVKALDAAIAAWTAGRGAGAVAEILQAAGINAYPVVTMAGLFSDPHCAPPPVRVRRHPNGRHAYCFRLRLAEAPGDIVGPAPCVGADNDFVFRDLVGLSEAEYESYRQQGVFD
jgi:crotonobetainyl-CoA:carnitine CoA-transferase CaiB-like acyl-CoA transferase